MLMENALHKKKTMYKLVKIPINNLLYCFLQNYSEPDLRLICQSIKMIFKTTILM